MDRRRLTQNTFCYSFSPLTSHALRIGPGSEVTIDLPDAFEGKIERETDEIPAQLNPVVGPIYVESAEKGDALAIEIKEIRLTANSGISILQNDAELFGGILFSEPRTEIKIIPVIDNKIEIAGVLNKWVRCEPSIGCIGTSPENEAILTDYAGPHGGNMDTPHIRAGSRLFLPVNVPGGLLSLGDVHASQGSGELFALDISAEVTITIDVVKNKKIGWPRIETEDSVITVSSASPVKLAVGNAYQELVKWVEEAYGLNSSDAHHLCTQVAVIEIAKIVLPTPTITVKLAKKYLEKLAQ